MDHNLPLEVSKPSLVLKTKLADPLSPGPYHNWKRDPTAAGLDRKISDAPLFSRCCKREDCSLYFVNP